MIGRHASKIVSPRSILVIRLSSLGDVILSTPIVRQLQRTFPDAILDVVVNERFSEVYAHNPRVRTVWPALVSTTVDGEMDAQKLAMKESVPGGRYDLVVDLQRNVQSATIRHGLGDVIVKYPKFRMQKLAMVYLKRFPDVTTSIVDRYRMPLEGLPLVMDTEGPEVWLASERAQGVYAPRRSPLPSYGNSPNTTSLSGMRVVIAPGAKHATKRWPPLYVAELCKMLVGEGAMVSLVGGPADVELCNSIVNAANVDIARHDGATSLEQTIHALDAADVLVTNDSGVMHLGASRRIPTVAVFGSTVKELGFAPYGTRHVVVEHDIACRPCSHIGRSACPKKHFNCMVQIKPIMVREAIGTLLGR